MDIGRSGHGPTRWMHKDETRSTAHVQDREGVRVRPGASAAISISGPTVENVLFVPRTAVFDAVGKPMVYQRNADGFDAKEIRIRAWTDSVAIVENIDPSAEIALVNPNAASGTRPLPPQAPAAPKSASR